MAVYHLRVIDYVVVDMARTTKVKIESLWSVVELVMETHKDGKWVSVLPDTIHIQKGYWLNRSREQLGPIRVRIKGKIGTAKYSDYILKVSHPDYPAGEDASEAENTPE